MSQPDDRTSFDDRIPTREQIAASLSLEDIHDGLQSMQGLRVAVVGETIIDEYAYCDAIGKSGKEPMIVNRFLRCDAQAGGVLAVANHVAEFCGDVEVVSALGTVEPREEFVRQSLRGHVRASFATITGSPTIVKRRYIDAYSRAKMMGVYHMDMTPIAGDDERSFLGRLEDALSRCDLCIVTDYGHGLLTPAAVELLTAKAPFLAVNTQLNAANTGYHVLSKYPRADYACLHEGELRLDARDLISDLAPLLERTAVRMGARAMMATLGKHGTMLWSRGSGIHRCPALADTVVERIGAGDAVLALSSMAIAAGLEPNIAGILGNLAGAQMVAVMGNSASIRRATLLASLRELTGVPQLRVAGVRP